MVDPDDLAAAAAAALAAGDGAAVVELCERGLASGDHGELHYLLGSVWFADDRLDDALAAWEAAFRAFNRDGVARRAARVATLLGELHWGGLGNEATGRGWLERARRLLEESGPCLEWGYLELARLACDRPDVEDLKASAERAIVIAAAHGDAALHVRALADSGVALVSTGAVAEGLSRLDEALACIASGEVTDPYVVSTSFCALLTAADRIGDVARVEEWTQLAARLVLDPTGGRPTVLRTHCSVALGSVLSQAGRWSEAEQVLRGALAGGGPSWLTHRIDAVARLAELRLWQGRVDEAAELLAPFEDQVGVAGPLAAIHLDRGDAALGAAVADRALAQLTGDAVRSMPLLVVAIDADLHRGDVEAATVRLSRLVSLAASAASPAGGAIVALARGRVAMAQADHAGAIASFEEATSGASGERPAQLAVAHLELAGAYAAAGRRDDAVAAARAAHAVARRLAAGPLCDRASAMLRDLGAVAPRPAERDAVWRDLTARERDVLDGICRGETNAQIGGRLYLSPKTVEHHVSRLLAKLGVRTRAEAAAVAAVAGVLDPRDPA